MAKNVTLADIAAEAGVSNVAVYKALTDKPGVSAERREEIKRLAAEMGYTNETSEKSQSGKAKTGYIGIIVPEQYYGYSVSFYGQMYERVVKSLYKNDYFGILELLNAEDESNNAIPKVMRNRKVDGVIFLGQMKETYVASVVRQAKVPVFFLDTYCPKVTFDTVISDGYYGTYVLTNYLIEQGHRKICFVGSVDATNSIADRFWGYRKALRENGIAFEESWEIPDRNETGESFETIMESADGVDALVCNCDFAADIVIRNLEERGYRIPEDVSVVGFDDFLMLGKDNSRITTYRVNMEQMAELCVKSLIKKMSGRKYAKGIQIVTGEMVCKSTVAERRLPHSG